MGKSKHNTPKFLRFRENTLQQARTSTKIFYTALLVVILIAVIGLSIMMNSLKSWLVRYEASQPDSKSRAVFTELFAKPNWGRVYELSGETASERVNAESYAKYMEDKVGSTPLSYFETSAGLSGDKKYIVQAGNEKVATFTLNNSTPKAEIPTWVLGDVDIFYSCDISVNIVTPGYRVIVNDIPLTNEHIIRAETTKAEKYLPEGITGERSCYMTVGGFLTEPTVRVLDMDGKPVSMSYDVSSRTYTLDTPAAPELKADSEEYQALLTATKTYCEYMIAEAKEKDLALCFDEESDIYQAITTGDNWVQKHKSYDFTEETISSYYRYSDTLYSAKIQLTMNVTRRDGTVKPYEMDHTLFMEKQEDSTWLATNLIQGDVQEVQSRVRLTYMVDGDIAASEIVAADSSTLTPPAVTAPEGKTFAGWFAEKETEDGKTVMELVFDPPGEDGQVHLPKESTLEPMTLHAWFQ